MANVVTVIPKIAGMDLVGWFYTLTFMVILLTFLIFLLILKGGKPMVAILKHQFFNRPLLILHRKDKGLEFIAAKYDTGNFTHKQQEFIAVPEGVYRIIGGGVGAIVDSRYGATLPMELIHFAIEAKAKNVRPEDFKDALDVLRLGTDNTITVETPEGEKITKTLELTETIKKVNAKLLTKYLYEISTEVSTSGDRTKYIKPVSILKTIDINAIAGYFIYNINPFAITARIQKRVTAELQTMQKGDWTKFIIPFMMLIFAVAIAVVIIRTGSPQQTSSMLTAATGAAASTMVT